MEHVEGYRYLKMGAVPFQQVAGYYSTVLIGTGLLDPHDIHLSNYSPADNCVNYHDSSEGDIHEVNAHEEDKGETDYDLEGNGLGDHSESSFPVDSLEDIGCYFISNSQRLLL